MCLYSDCCCVQVLVPTSQFIRSLVAARLAADVLDVPTVLIARTDAHSAALLTSDVDEVDRAFCTGERTPEGFYRVKEGVKVRHKASVQQLLPVMQFLRLAASQCFAAFKDVPSF